MSIGPTPTAREDNALRGGGGRGRKGKGEDERCAGVRRDDQDATMDGEVLK